MVAFIIAIQLLIPNLYAIGAAGALRPAGAAAAACQANCSGPNADVCVDLPAHCLCMNKTDCIKIDIGQSGPSMTTASSQPTKMEGCHGDKYNAIPGPGTTDPGDMDCLDTKVPENTAVGKWIHKVSGPGGGDTTLGCIGIPAEHWPKVKAMEGKTLLISGGSGGGGGADKNVVAQAVRRSRSVFMALMSVLFPGSSSNAGQKDIKFGTDGAIRSNAKIEVRSYDKKSKTFVVFSVRLPGEGDSYVSAEGLAEAVPSLSVEELRVRPKEQIANQYVLAKPLRNFTKDELKIREARFSKIR